MAINAPETQQFVRVHRDCGKSAHAAGDDAQTRAQHHLSEPMTAQLAEETPLGMDINEFDHQHHDDDQTGDQEAVAQYIEKQVEKIVHRS
jgi:hypothetical protein